MTSATAIDGKAAQDVESGRKARRPRIGLAANHPRRDLPGMVLTALELVQAGATAVVMPAHKSWIDATFADLDAVLLNNARDSTIGRIRWLTGLGLSIFVLDDEGYLSSERHAVLTNAIAKLGLGSTVEGYFVWGEASGKAIAKADPGLASKVLATGAPRFDLLAPRWRGMLQYDRKGYILLNPNFNGVNPTHGDPERTRRRMLRDGSWNPEDLDRLLADLRQGFAAFLDLCAELPRRLPHRQFVVRPHPFEDWKPYERALAGIANVHLNIEGPISPVLANATHLVHLNCNTSVEARLLGLPAIQAGFLNTPLLRQQMPIYTGVSVSAESMDDLCRLLDDPAFLAERDNTGGVFEQWIRPSFHDCDGFAGRRVAETLLARIALRDRRRPAQANTPLLRRVKLGLSHALGTAAMRRVRRLLRPVRAAKAFTTEDVRRLVEAYSRQAGCPMPPVRRLRSRWTGLPMSAIQIG
jgi:surface carbohydrate biosynthesis protein